MKKQEKTETQTCSNINSPKFHMHQLLVRFSPSLTRMQQQRLLSERVIEILSDPMFCIRGNYHQQNWKDILPYIQESYCRRFFLVGVEQCSILKEISLIKFACLKQIDLSSNKIDNLQLISMIKIPHVKSIVLKNNIITNLQSLRKGKWKDIEQIDLQGNHFIQWSKITEMFANPNLIDSLDIAFYSVHSISSLQDIAILYSKYMTNKQSQLISRNLSFFNKQSHQLPQLPRQNNQSQIDIIALESKRYQALKRKFQKSPQQ